MGCGHQLAHPNGKGTFLPGWKSVVHKGEKRKSKTLKPLRTTGRFISFALPKWQMLKTSKRSRLLWSCRKEGRVCSEPHPSQHTSEQSKFIFPAREKALEQSRSCISGNTTLLQRHPWTSSNFAFSSNAKKKKKEVIFKQVWGFFSGQTP